jgi:hypothetical protein
VLVDGSGFAPRFHCDGRAIHSSTVIEAGARSLLAHTSVDEAGLEVHSSFVCVEHEGIVVAHLIVADGRPPRPIGHETIGDPTLDDDRLRLLLEHLGYVRDAVAESTAGVVSVDFGL